MLKLRHLSLVSLLAVALVGCSEEKVSGADSMESQLKAAQEAAKNDPPTKPKSRNLKLEDGPQGAAANAPATSSNQPTGSVAP